MKKKVLLSILAVCSLFVFAGCGNSNSKEEKVMKEYATTFYNAHQKGDQGLTVPKISIKDLKEAVALEIDNFDMSKLDKCTDESYVELTLDDAREIKSVTYHLECNK